MTTINNLSTIDSVAGGDQVPVYDASAGTARKMSVSQLLAFFSANFASPDYTVTISSPIAGFNQQLAAAADSIWLLLTPAGTLATGTVTLPPVADLYDGQEVLVTSTAEITSLTVAGNGATVSGAPAALAADGFFRLRYNLLLTTWYCVAQSLGSSQTVFTSLEVDNLTLNTAILDSNGAQILTVLPSASADNTLGIFNGVSGGADTEVGLYASGVSTDIPINIVPKGAGEINLNADTYVDGEQVVTVTSVTPQTGKVFVDQILIQPATVATLPSVTDNAGARASVTDSNAALTAGIGAVVAGGGANIVPVFCDGTNWRIG